MKTLILIFAMTTSLVALGGTDISYDSAELDKLSKSPLSSSFKQTVTAFLQQVPARLAENEATPASFGGETQTSVIAIRRTDKRSDDVKEYRVLLKVSGMGLYGRARGVKYVRLKVEEQKANRGAGTPKTQDEAKAEVTRMEILSLVTDQSINI